MKNYGGYWKYPSMTQMQYNDYLQSYVQHTVPASMFAPTYEYLVCNNLVPPTPPPPPPPPPSAPSYSAPAYQRYGKRPGPQQDNELNTPEEIDKWIAQRRKNFPTRTHIESKKNNEKLKAETGALSKLERKLRQKIKFIKSADGPPQRYGGNRNWRNNRPNSGPNPNAHTQNTPQARPAQTATQSTGVPVAGKRPETEEQKKPEQPTAQGQQGVASEKAAEKGQNCYGKNKRRKKKVGEAKVDRFKYRQNTVYQSLIRQEVDREHSILLQVFRYFVKNGMV